MNPIERGQVCVAAHQAILSGEQSLDVIPGLIKKIIASRAWEEREIGPGRFVKLSSFRELITAKPMNGWGENPDKIEALLRDDPEALACWREAMKQQGKRTDFLDNIKEVGSSSGTSRSYTVTRLKHEAPELFEQVVAGELSANAAAIKAGIRKKPNPDDIAIKAVRKAENRLVVLKTIVDELQPHERELLREWLTETTA